MTLLNAKKIYTKKTEIISMTLVVVQNSKKDAGCWGKKQNLHFSQQGHNQQNVQLNKVYPTFLQQMRDIYWKFSADSGCTYRVRIFRHIDFTKMNQFVCNKFTTFTATTTSNRFDDTESIVHRWKP